MTHTSSRSSKRRSLSWLAVVLLLSLGAGCKKDPSPAQLALEHFALTVAQGGSTEGLVLDDQKVTYVKNGDEPAEGSINTLAPVNIGVVDWARTSVEKDFALPNGDRRVQLIFNVCVRGDDQAQCSRPSQYRLRGLLRPVGGTWKVAGSSCEVLAEVR